MYAHVIPLDIPDNFNCDSFNYLISMEQWTKLSDGRGRNQDPQKPNISNELVVTKGRPTLFSSDNSPVCAD